MNLQGFVGRRRQEVVCKFFAKGICRNGDECPFLHLGKENSKIQNSSKEAGKLADEETKNETVKDANLSKENGHREKTEDASAENKNPTKYDNKRFQQRIVYRRKTPTSPKPSANEEGMPGRDRVERNSSTDEKSEKETRNSMESNKMKVFCKFYIRGCCARGRFCPFLHEKPQVRNPLKPATKTNSKSTTAFPAEGEELDAEKSTTAFPAEGEELDAEKSTNAFPAEGEELDAEKSTNEEKICGRVANETGKSRKMGVRNFCNDRKSYLRRYSIPKFIRESQKFISRPMMEKSPEEMRKLEIDLLIKKFPDALKVERDDNSTTYQFTFIPSDPDWPFDVKELEMIGEFPEKYPLKAMKITMGDNEIIPDSVQNQLNEEVEEWLTSRHESSHALDHSLVFRPFIKWFDRNIEELMINALKQYKKEMTLAASGLQFLSGAQLRRKYHGVVPIESSNQKSPTTESTSGVGSENIDKNTDDNKSSENVTNDEKDGNAEKDEEVEVAAPTTTTASLEPPKRGTEARLNNLELSGIASLLCSKLKATMACGRCSNKMDVGVATSGLSNSSSFSIGCLYCSNRGTAQFHRTIVHSSGHTIGYFDLDGCHVVDILLSSCEFQVACFKCMKENLVKSLFPGQQSDTWCLECHQKMSIKVNNVKVIRLESTLPLKATTSAQVESDRKAKSVKDPAIQDGKPLPMFGTCKHFKKSFRWFRFPCCGRAYPCDLCHEEAESHEMKLANRIICGFCAMEQPHSSSNLCIRCGGHVTSKFTSHWEGGKGCRDQIKMSRGDSKKYSNSKVNSQKTKLRHAL